MHTNCVHRVTLQALRHAQKTTRWFEQRVGRQFSNTDLNTRMSTKACRSSQWLSQKTALSLIDVSISFNTALRLHKPHVGLPLL